MIPNLPKMQQEKKEEKINSVWWVRKCGGKGGDGSA